MKHLIASAALGVAVFASVTAEARTPADHRFEHDGRIYSYSVEQVGDVRVINGVEERTGKPFQLRVYPGRVRGTVGSQQISFPLKDVEPLEKPIRTLASR